MRALWLKLGLVIYWVGWPFFWLYLHDSERSRVLIICDQKILVVKAWIGDGKWSLPGGGIHSGEQPEAGALREVVEETGVSLSKSGLKPLMVEMSNKDGHSFLSHYFLALIKEQPSPKPQLWEIVASRWIKIEDINAKNCGFDVLRALELYTWKAK